MFILLGDDLPAAAASGLVAFAEAGGYPGSKAFSSPRRRFPSAHPCWSGC
ncbi:MAG: hypothetical protein MZV49_22370 [Rhodopseudomonas palustris]|nr:hypothetical protein [Rhodopseudomonas palustris]